MIDSLKKTLLASLGVVAFTKEKLERVVHDLVERGELTRDQGKNVVKALLERGDSEGKHLVDKLVREVERLLGASPLATRGELRTLSERVASLESRLGGTSGDDGEGYDPSFAS